MYIYSVSFSLYAQQSLSAEDVAVLQATEINNQPMNECIYTIASLVTNLEQYQDMLCSFRQAGFDDSDCEFIYINNSQGNSFDAYEGLNKCLTLAKGQFVILCHQDIALNHDTRAILDTKIDEITKLDPAWAILGNAGGNHRLDRLYRRISDPHGENQSFGPYPAKVNSLDENFLVVKKSANLGLSRDISGFHLYATDLCLIAETLGYSSYVIDFHLTHYSGGTVDTTFYRARKAFIHKYQRAFSSRYIRTPATKLFLSQSTLLNNLLNSKIMLSIKKRIDSLHP